jgi:hypothetical protein
MSTLQSRTSVPEDVIFREVGGEAVIVNLESGQYYGLDDVGTRMWMLLDEHGQVALTYEALLAEYEVGEDRLRRDLLALIDELASHGLLQVDEG